MKCAEVFYVLLIVHPPIILLINHLVYVTLCR